jgi:hypothetical protein
MKTKQLVPNAEQNGNAPTKQPHASNTASMQINAEVLSNPEKPKSGLRLF